MKVWKIPCNTEFKVTYPYGVFDENLNWYNADKRHHGTDIVIADRKVVSASGSGVVIFAGWNNEGYGNLVIVEDGEYRFYYAHLEQVLVNIGQNVNWLTQIGIQGATGNVTGEHLHFEVRKNGRVIDSSQYMGIPNDYGTYYPSDYGYDLDNNTHKYSVGDLVVFSHFYLKGDSDTRHDTMMDFGSWQQDFIKTIKDRKNPYMTELGHYLRDDCIQELKGHK